LGDLLTGAPALRGIRAAYPDHELILIAPAWQRPVAAMFGVDRLIVADGLDGLVVTESGCDLAVDLHGCGPRSTEVLQAGRHRRVVAFRHPDVAGLDDMPRWRSEEHELDRWARLLGAAGVIVDTGDIHLDPGEFGPSPFADSFVVHCGAASPARRWPPGRFAEVIAHLVARGHKVVLSGTTAEATINRRVRAELSPRAAAHVLDLGGRTTLIELCSLVAGARAVLCGDTGVGHLATALRRPSVLLFGPTPPSCWGPRGGPHRVLWRGGSGDPHAHTVDPGLAEITVADVVAEIDALLATTNDRRLPG
jgi:ADP-heptose:LPS heptosyltransferase